MGRKKRDQRTNGPTNEPTDGQGVSRSRIVGLKSLCGAIYRAPLLIYLKISCDAGAPIKGGFTPCGNFSPLFPAFSEGVPDLNFSR